jgi:hypothetical protein
LRGDWRTAASLWQRRGEPYEEGLELVSGGGTSPSRGIELLRSLGAEATIAALPRPGADQGRCAARK